MANQQNGGNEMLVRIAIGICVGVVGVLGGSSFNGDTTTTNTTVELIHRIDKSTALTAAKLDNVETILDELKTTMKDNRVRITVLEQKVHSSQKED